MTIWLGADHGVHVTAENSSPPAGSVSLKRDKSESEVDENEDNEEPVRKRSRKEDARDQLKHSKTEEDKDGEEPVRKRSRREDAKDLLKQSKSRPASKAEKGTPKVKAAASKPGTAKRDSKSSPKKTESSSEKVKAIDSKNARRPQKEARHSPSKEVRKEEENDLSDEVASEAKDEEAESDDEDKPEVAAKAREKVQSTLKSSGNDPYPDWKPGQPVPYAALCTTFSLIEMTTKRLIISAHCSLFLRQILRLTPQDLLPTVQLMINKLAADYAGIELGIGESLIMKAIGETTGRSLQVIKADQNEIGDLGLVAAKSRSNQPTMFKPKPLTVRGVLEGLMGIATVSGDGSQGRKIAGIKKLLSAADTSLAGKGNKGIDITKDKGGASEAKFIVRFLEGKLRLGLAERTVLVGVAHAMVIHETEKKGSKLPSSEKLAEGEAILKTVYR